MLEAFRPCFTAPTFTTFATLLVGLIAQPVNRTVCGMLAGAGLAGVWHRHRAPWYTTKRYPSYLDMIVKLRRVLIAAQDQPELSGLPTPTKSTPCGWPGPRPVRNRETRVLSDPLDTIEHMLPETLFNPLDLADAIEDTERAYGPSGVVDLLVAALTDRRVRRDSDIDEYLEKLKSVCRQTRRYRDAIPVFQRIAALNPAREDEVAAELALVHAHLGDPRAGMSLLKSAYAAQRRLPARRRSFAFCLVAELAATVLRHPTMARDVAAMGRAAALARPLGPSAARYRTLDDIDLLLADRRRPRLAIVRGAAA